MESLKINRENANLANEWSDLSAELERKDFFSEEAFADRMNQYLESVDADGFMSVIRGYRKHLDGFQQKFSNSRFAEKYDNNPDLLNVYAFSTLVKDYLSNCLEIKGLDLEIKEKDFNNTEGGHINLRSGKIYVNFDYHRYGTLEDVTKVIAHEIWHARQAISAFKMEEDGSAIKTPYYDALFVNYQNSTTNHEDYYNQAVEREARMFADAFQCKIFSANSSYEVWMQEKYGLPAEYYGRLATDRYMFDTNDEFGESFLGDGDEG